MSLNRLQINISSIKKKLSRTIGIIYKLRHFVNKNLLISIYYSLIYPFLIGPLVHTLPIFHELEILTITDIFKLQTAKFVYNCLNLLAPIQFKSFFTFTNTNYNTAVSRNENLNIPHARTTNYGLNSIKNVGARIWNHIPINIRRYVSVKSFTRNLKQHI